MPNKPINISRAQVTVQLVADYLVHNGQRGPNRGTTLISWLSHYGLTGRGKDYLSGYARRAKRLLDVLHRDGMVVMGYSQRGRETYYPAGPLYGIDDYKEAIRVINRFYKITD